MWYATCCSRQYVVGSEHHRKGVIQEAMSGATATWNSWRGLDLSREPNLTGADLRRADLRGAELSEADLTEANLAGADLVRPNLARAELPRADLSEANLSGTNLTEADLSGANLAGADLSGVDLAQAILVGAILSGADLSTASVTQLETGVTSYTFSSTGAIETSTRSVLRIISYTPDGMDSNAKAPRSSVAVMPSSVWLCNSWTLKDPSSTSLQGKICPSMSKFLSRARGRKFRATSRSSTE